MKKSIAILLIAAFLTSGCSTMRTSPQFSQNIPNIKTIAVMPLDVKVFKITAGGVTEEIDEWSDKAKTDIKTSLQAQLSLSGFEVKFVDESWLKEQNKELWTENKALYEMVSNAITLHAISGHSPAVFKTKIKNFDYTLGVDVSALSEMCGADSLLFVYGYDHEATAGRIGLYLWGIAVAAATGIVMIPSNPSSLTMALIDGKTGQVEWFKMTPPKKEYSFINTKQIDSVVQWLTKELLETK
jgi:hypothetical protein